MRHNPALQEIQKSPVRSCSIEKITLLGNNVFSGSKSMKVSVSLENEHNPPPLVPNHIVPFISSNNVITELLVIVVVSSRICSKCSQRSFTVL